MINVDPIKDIKKVNALKTYLLGAGNLRNYSMVVLGLNTALRIGDILSMKWGMIYDFEDEEFRQNVYLQEEKTEKHKKLVLNSTAIEALRLYFDSIELPNKDDYVFKSREGINSPITRQRAYSIIKNAADAVGVKGNIGCHSLRKTFGYFSAKKGVPMHILMRLFNHSSENITKDYLGITQDDIDKVYTMIEL